MSDRERSRKRRKKTMKTTKRMVSEIKLLKEEIQKRISPAELMKILEAENNKYTIRQIVERITTGKILEVLAEIELAEIEANEE